MTINQILFSDKKYGENMLFGDIIEKKEKERRDFNFYFNELSWIKQTKKLLIFIEDQQ